MTIAHGYAHALALLILTGCAASLKAPPLETNHPASHQAIESPLPIPSTTLKTYRDRSRSSVSESSEKESTSDAAHQSKAPGEPMPQTDSHSGHGADHEASSGGRPGDTNKVNRDILVAAFDSMRYDSPTILVHKGETIRFVVTNKGQLTHEFVIGDRKQQSEHAEMMRKMPNMQHSHDNALSLTPGQTKSLVWEFTESGDLEIACHVPGHYEAGMRTQVQVRKENGHDAHKH